MRHSCIQDKTLAFQFNPVYDNSLLPIFGIFNVTELSDVD